MLNGEWCDVPAAHISNDLLIRYFIGLLDKSCGVRHTFRWLNCWRNLECVQYISQAEKWCSKGRTAYTPERYHNRINLVRLLNFAKGGHKVEYKKRHFFGCSTCTRHGQLVNLN